MNNRIENIKKLIVSKPLKLDCGKTIINFPLAYETFGKLNNDKNNAILVFHALTEINLFREKTLLQIRPDGG